MPMPVFCLLEPSSVYSSLQLHSWRLNARFGCVTYCAQAKDTEVKVFYSYEQRKPGARVTLQHFGYPHLSDKHVFVPEGLWQFWTRMRVPENAPLFWRYPNFLPTRCRIGAGKLPCQNPARFVHPIRQNFDLWQTQTRTERFLTKPAIRKSEKDTRLSNLLRKVLRPAWHEMGHFGDSFPRYM